MHEALQAILTSIDGHMALDAFTRKRGGHARGVAWGEIAGRLRDGSFAELRMHYTPSTSKLMAGLLIYQPLARGGRMVVFGEIVAEDGTLEERQARVVTAMREWLDKLEEEL